MSNYDNCCWLTCYGIHSKICCDAPPLIWIPVTKKTKCFGFVLLLNQNDWLLKAITETNG